MTWEYLGASPTPMGVAELFTSLQNGVVDGQENPLEVIEQQKYNEVQKFVVETGHVMGAMTFIFFDQRFKQFPPSCRQRSRKKAIRPCWPPPIAWSGWRLS